MRLKVVTPSEIFEADGVQKINAEDAIGNFCLLPHHIDYVASLLPGILSFERSGAIITYIALDEGILVKKGLEVTVSCMNMVIGGGLGSLKKAVEENFEALSDSDKKMRASLSRLEADFIRHFKELR